MDVDWSHDKSKHRNANTVVPMPGGGTPQVTAETSQVCDKPEEDPGTAGRPLAEAQAQHRTVPSLTCTPVISQEAVPV